MRIAGKKGGNMKTNNINGEAVGFVLEAEAPTQEDIVGNNKYHLNGDDI